MVERDSESRMVIGFHQFTLENYSLCKGVRRGNPIYSDSFIVGGHEWAVSVFPDGTEESNSTSGGVIEEEIKHVYVGFRVSLRSRSDDGVRCRLKITLLDQSGQGNHRTSPYFDDGESPLLISTGQHKGFPNFIRRDKLDNSCYLKDDCLKIECTLGVVLPFETETEAETTTPSFDDVSLCEDNTGFGLDFLDLLEAGEGSDVIFDVKGGKFHAHKLILSARSSVFESMFHTNQSEEIVITDIEPHVFKVLLHFIYSDNLPESEKSLSDAYAFGTSVSTTIVAKLLAAADKYNVIRLKSICESHLWRSISVNRFVETLLLADRYNASKLKHLCFEYAAKANLHAGLVQSESIAYLQKNFPSMLINELDDYLLSKGMRSLHLRQSEEECLS